MKTKFFLAYPIVMVILSTIPLYCVGKSSDNSERNNTDDTNSLDDSCPEDSGNNDLNDDDTLPLFDNGDGTLTDPNTGLIWEQEPSIEDTSNYLAENSCFKLEIYGWIHKWRLPTVSELRSLIRGCSATQTGGGCKVTDQCNSSYCCENSQCIGCSISPEGCYWPESLVGDCGFYWSSTYDESNSGIGSEGGSNWAVDFSEGQVRQVYDFSSLHVRCVRRLENKGTEFLSPEFRPTQNTRRTSTSSRPARTPGSVPGTARSTRPSGGIGPG